MIIQPARTEGASNFARNLYPVAMQRRAQTLDVEKQALQVVIDRRYERNAHFSEARNRRERARAEREAQGGDSWGMWGGIAVGVLTMGAGFAATGASLFSSGGMIAMGEGAALGGAFGSSVDAAMTGDSRGAAYGFTRGARMLDDRAGTDSPIFDMMLGANQSNDPFGAGGSGRSQGLQVGGRSDRPTGGNYGY